MKTKFIAMVLTLLSASGTLTIGKPLPAKQSHPRLQSFAISQYGTLLQVFNSKGESRFGMLDLDGYSVSYKFRGQDKTRTVSALGETAVIGLQPGRVTVDGQSASVTVTTDDYALEITNSFTLNLERDRLTIRRSVKNMSGKSLTLMRTEQYLEPKLLGVQSTLGSEPIKEAVLRQRTIANGCTDQAADSPPHNPPCYTVVCSQNNISSALLVIEKQKPPSLVWKCKKFFPSQRSTSASGNVVTEAHFVVDFDISDSA